MKVYFALSVPFVAILLGVTGPRAARLMTIFTQHRPADLWLKWHGIVPTAIVTDDLKTFRSVLTQSGLFRTAFCTPLRRHHVPLVIHFLVFFTENKDIFALHTRNFDIWHSITSGPLS